MANSKDKSSEVAATNGESGNLAQPPQLRQFHDMMRMRALTVNTDRGAEVMQRQALAIITAETVEDIVSADMGGTIQARDVDGLEVEIQDMEPITSARDDIETREGYYVSMNCVCLGGDEQTLTRMGLKVGKEFVLQTGAELFALKVGALENAGGLPFRGRVTAIRTQSGNHVVKLYPLPARVTYATAGVQPAEPPF